jgi:hypothetical protein
MLSICIANYATGHSIEKGLFTLQGGGGERHPEIQADDSTAQ